MSEVTKVEANKLSEWNPNALSAIKLDKLAVSSISDNSEYWSPSEKGEVKLVFFESMSVEKVLNPDTGEEKLLPTVHLYEQDKNYNHVRLSNSSARLVGLFERMGYERGTPLQITYLGKEKNKNNAYQSDSWDVRQLFIKNS